MAAECAWAVFRIEHARIRELLRTLNCALDPVELKSGAHTARLIALIERLQAFDEGTHRPKGQSMIAKVRSRSPEAEQLVLDLEAERERFDRLLSESKSMLEDRQAEGAGLTPDVVARLKAHRQAVLAHLEREETLLHSKAAELLDGEDWAELASSMSAHAEAVQSATTASRRRLDATT